MEKISYPPLITHLKEHEEYYSSILGQYELNHGLVPGDVIKHWMATSIEPLVRATSNGDSAKVSRINRALFSELLNLLKHRVDLPIYEKAWQLLSAVPDLFSQKPTEIIRVIDDGLQGVLTYQPKKGEKWLEIMESSLPDCLNVAQMKALGQTAAWLCGLAHLRIACRKSFEILPEGLTETLQKFVPKNKNLKDLLAQDWNEENGEHMLGGFIGFEKGLFEKPPIVGLVDDVVMATDDKSVCAIFHDAMGTVVLNDINLSSQLVTNGAGNAREITHKKYRDVSSSIQINNSLIFTRTSSHYIHISTVR